MSDFFPIELDADQVTISQLDSTGEWEIIIDCEDGKQFVHYIDMPDNLYEQLVEKGVLIHRDGEVVKA